MEATIEAIGREVRTRMKRAGLTQREAAALVAEEFTDGENGRLKALLDTGFLAFAFAEAESETLHTDPIYAGGGDQESADNQALSEAPVRTRYDEFFAKPYDQWVPVPGTGERKRLGDWTADDLTAVSRFYAQREKTAKVKRRRFARVAEVVGPERTVEEAWADIGEEDQKLLAA